WIRDALTITVGAGHHSGRSVPPHHPELVRMLRWSDVARISDREPTLSRRLLARHRAAGFVPAMHAVLLAGVPALRVLEAWVGNVERAVGRPVLAGDGARRRGPGHHAQGTAAQLLGVARVLHLRATHVGRAATVRHDQVVAQLAVDD